MKKDRVVSDRINFAQKDVRRYKKGVLISGIVVLTFSLLLILCFVIFSFEVSPVVLLVMQIVSLAAILFMIFLTLYVDGKIYLRDLKKKGFAVPWDKKEYEYKLSMLPGAGEAKEVPKRAVQVRMLVLAVITGAVTVSAAIYSFTEAKRPYPGCMLIALIVTVIMFLQAFNRFYKNDIDIEIVDSRRVRQRIVPAVVTVGIIFFVLLIWGGMLNSLPTFNYLYHDQIIRYYKEDDAESWRFHMDSLPPYAEKIEFMSWGKTCSLSFHVPRENIKDMQAYFESFDEPYVIHTIEEGEEDFTKLCEEVKHKVTNFDSQEYGNCIVYEYTEFCTCGYCSGSWYAIIDTESGEVGYGNYTADW